MVDMTGTWDLHIHALPCILGRAVDDISVAEQCRAMGMAGIAVKAHLESTSSRAWHVNRQIPGFRYVGGIALNYPVGGINPSAVDACLRLGGRIVWMPSGHSRFHAEVKGKLGAWGPADMTLYVPPGATGITVLDADGNLTRDARDVIDVIRGQKAVLASSHCSPAEIRAMAAYCRAEGVKFVMTHILWVPQYSMELAKYVIEQGGIVELTAGVVGGYNRKVNAAEAVDIIRELGPRNMLLSSDCGGTRSTAPAEAMRVMVANLVHARLPAADARTMMVDIPEMLIGDGAPAPVATQVAAHV